MEVQFSNIPISLDAMLPQNQELLHSEIIKVCGLKDEHIGNIRVIRKSVDARKKSNVHFVLTVVVNLPDFNESSISHLKLRKGISSKLYVEPEALKVPDLSNVSSQPDYLRPVIVGAGPAGLFCALYLARAGLQPLVIERGKPANERMNDIQEFAAGGKLNMNSNVQFGEGGAGTFSDGKLNTGIKSPHIRHVLQELVDAGAPDDIIVEAKPHIGTDMLVEVVQNLRQAIENAGGEFRFNTKLEEIDFERLTSLNIGNEEDHPEFAVRAIKVRHIDREGLTDSISEDVLETIPVDNLVLAIGHSARDTFEMLNSIGVSMERKPFAMGLRVEHLQDDLNRSQYGKFADHDALGAADYKLAMHTKDGRGVYTFCMCPGGNVVAAASEEGGVCVNGMSEHVRAGVNGNSAILVEIKPDDLSSEDVLEGMRLQRDLERTAFEEGRQNGGTPYAAPVQTVSAFLENRIGAPSKKIKPTYPRGASWVNLRESLPDLMSESIAEAIPVFGKKLDAFDDGEAVLTGVEARSSSPVRIVRNRDNMTSVFAKGLYPCGEGAGYAGGIMSAAVDGIRVAEAICESA